MLTGISWVKHTGGFGWLKNYEDVSISQTPFYISDTELSNGTYLLEWFNTWTGEYIDTDTAVGVQGISWGDVTGVIDKEDVAFKLGRLDGGAAAIQVELALIKKDTLIPGDQPWLPKVASTIYRIVCCVTDENNMLDIAFNGPVDIVMDGEGQPDPFTLQLQQGGVVFDYHRSGSSPATVTATVDGLGKAVLNIEGMVGIEEREALQPAGGFELMENYPNPFDQSTRIAYVLSENARITLSVYNAQGKLMETLVEDYKTAGKHEAIWNAGDYPAGIYFYRMGNEHLSITKRCILLN